MVWVTSFNRIDTPSAAKAIDQSMVGLIARLKEWRAYVSATGNVDSQELANHLQAVVALKAELVAATALPGIAEAFRAMFPDKPEFDPGAEYPPLVTALDSFTAWVIDAWPFKVDAGGGVTLMALDQVTATGSLQRFNLPLDQGGRQVLIAYIDGILARFGQA